MTDAVRNLLRSLEGCDEGDRRQQATAGPATALALATPRPSRPPGGASHQMMVSAGQLGRKRGRSPPRGTYTPDHEAPTCAICRTVHSQDCK